MRYAVFASGIAIFALHTARYVLRLRYAALQCHQMNEVKSGKTRRASRKIPYNVRVNQKLMDAIRKFCAARGWTQTVFAERAFNKFIVEN